MYTLLLCECFHTLRLARAQFIKITNPAKFPRTGSSYRSCSHLPSAPVFTLISRLLVISETFPTSLAKGNKAGVQCNVCRKTQTRICVSLMHFMSLAQVIPAWNKRHFRCFRFRPDNLQQNCCCPSWANTLANSTRTDISQQIFQTFHLNRKHVFLCCSSCPFYQALS